MLDDEKQLSDRYAQAGSALIDAIINKPSEAPALMGPYLQLYTELQGRSKKPATNWPSAKQAELGAQKTAARATSGMFVICGISLLIQFSGSILLVQAISKSLKQLIEMIQDIAEGEGDATKRLEAAGSLGNNELGEVSRLFNVFMDKLQEILRGVVAHTRKVTTASRQMLEAAGQITTHSGETAIQSNAVSSATRQVSQNLNSLSTGAVEMTSTIQSIAVNAQEGRETGRIGGERRGGRQFHRGQAGAVRPGNWRGH